jgi:hypothetical protein
MSIYTGVYKVGKRWRARRSLKGESHCLGTFDTEVEAARAYDEFCWQNHLRFIANFPAPTDRTRIQLTQGKVARIDAEDWDRVYRHSLWRYNEGYAVSQGMKMHRVIMDAPDGLDVDHINHDTLDNRKSNLRLCTRADGTRYSRGWVGARNVLPRPSGKFGVQVAKKWYGTYETEEEAIVVATDVRNKLYGEFACHESI